MIEIKHLRKVFDDDTIPLKDIDVTINDGDVISTSRYYLGPG